MIHGGGYMTLSKSAIRPAQTRFLLSKGVLPVSLDHRLCPEINIIDGPMSDVRDGVGWARSALPRIALGQGIAVDTDKVAIIGWSTGGHLAMTTAWTTVEAGMAPPSVILSFYGASDLEALGRSPVLQNQQLTQTDLVVITAANGDLGQTFPGRTISIARIRASLAPKPVSDTVEYFVSLNLTPFSYRSHLTTCPPSPTRVPISAGLRPETRAQNSSSQSSKKAMVSPSCSMDRQLSPILTITTQARSRLVAA